MTGPCTFGTATSTHPGAPWTALILPYIEQAPIYNLLNFSEGFPHQLLRITPNTPALMTRVPVFQCPSSPAPPPSWVIPATVQFPALSVPNIAQVINSYSACMGGGDVPTTPNTQNADACSTATAFTGNAWLAAHFHNGLIGVNSKRSLADCTDGSSNVVLAGETIYPGMQPLRGWGCSVGTHAPGNRIPVNLTGTCDPINSGRRIYLSLTNGTSDQSIHNMIATRVFGSQHAGGCQFIMADGSVHFISETINLALYKRLGAMGDGQPVGGFSP